MMPPIVAMAPASVSIEEQLSSADPAVRRAAVENVLARPEAVDPFAWALMSKALWEDGRRLQAAFWFYVFQARSRAWADVDKGGDGAAALRGSVNEMLGAVINPWLGSDLAAWQQVARRAMSYEARLPLGSVRPDGVSDAAWRVAVADARSSYRAGFDQTLGRMTAAELAASRRKAGLSVGPLDQPGPALPDSWR